MTTSRFLSGLLLFCLPASAFAARPIDGRSATHWQAQPHWAPGREAQDCALVGSDGWLDASVAGDNALMTWTLKPTPQELENEPRYLVFTYRATRLRREGSSYLLAIQDGSPGWRQFLGGGDLVADGEEHVLAVDLLTYSPPEPINRLALRIGPPTDGRGRLLLKMRFANQLPNGVTPKVAAPVAPAKVRIEFEDIEWNPSPHWIPRPPTAHEMQRTERGVQYRMVGQSKAMRWSAQAPEGLDVGKMPFVSVRYRARGRFGPYGYTFYLSVIDDKDKKLGTYPMEPGNVEGDDRWHVFHTKLGEKGIGRIMAVGIDSLTPEAEIEMDYVEYSSQPSTTPITDLLTFEARTEPWPRGKGGLTTVRLAKSAVPPNHFMIPRLGIGSWFETQHITVEGVPFEVPTEPSAMLASGTVGEDQLSIDLPPHTREVLLLLAAAFPAGEKFGANRRKPTPLRLLSEPERLTVELLYRDGTSDHLLPVHAFKAAYGVGHDVAMYAVHPSPGLSPVKLILHDNLRNACFGIIGATTNAGEPKIAEPALQKIWYPPVKKPARAYATFSFGTEDGLTWDRVKSDMLGASVDLAGSPVFSLTLGEKDVPSSKWSVVEITGDEEKFVTTATYAEGDISLRAVFEARDEGASAVRLSLNLTNAGNAPVTGSLLFPYVSGLKIGSLEDTWYFCARRGGVINRVPCYWRDEIGEAHPLQVDGFFNPKVGAGISFMPRDMDGLFRWYRLIKDSSGGSYALEFLPQTVAPGGKWSSVPTVVAVVPGDWRDQLKMYLKWVKTWYRPLVPRKQWFREVFAFGPGSPTGRMDRPVEQRIDFLAKARQVKAAIGACDYMHLFGWAKTDRYGHWGDYNHYDAVGGRQSFVKQVRRCQDAGTPVGLYLDGYLVSTKAADMSSAQREQWAVRRKQGDMLYHQSYDAHSMCPYVRPWRDYLTSVYRRVAAEVQPDGMYLDELGKCMTHRTCYSTAHGHPSPMGMSPGERLLIRQIREALPAKIATYCEYIPSDVTGQYLDGGFGHVPLHGWRRGYDDVAPHYVNLQRFAFPDFKTFQLIYYVPQENGNWFLLKYPFFDGDGYYLTSSCIDSDEHARAFYRNVFRVQHEHADAFTSDEVEPLVRTEAPNLFANRFSTPDKTVWTLFNANYRTQRSHLMTVPHVPGRSYRDAWSNRPVEAKIRDGRAELFFEIGPRSVGCIVQWQ